MIVFDLLCSAGHRFEGWFGSAMDFASQKERGALNCPTCGVSSVERVPSATRYNSGAESPQQPSAQTPTQAPAEAPDATKAAQLAYSRLLDQILTATEDVGREFPAEARRIFYRETPARAIRGQASDEEHEALIDEGIPVQRLPFRIPDRLN
jgi:hypothetical protein